MAKVKAVIFDLNSIFLQSEHLSERIEERYGVSRDEFYSVLKEVMEKARRPGVDDSFKLWQPHLQKLGLSLSREEFFNFWFSGEKLAPEVLEYAKELRKKGIKVFILSNNFKERTEYYRKNFPEIFGNVDGAYFSWETGFVKPDTQAYQNLLRQNGLEPENCLYFDDSSKNIEVAIGLGIDSQEYQDLKKIKEYIESRLRP